MNIKRTIVTIPTIAALAAGTVFVVSSLRAQAPNRRGRTPPPTVKILSERKFPDGKGGVVRAGEAIDLDPALQNEPRPVRFEVTALDADADGRCASPVQLTARWLAKQSTDPTRAKVRFSWALRVRPVLADGKRVDPVLEHVYDDQQFTVPLGGDYLPFDFSASIPLQRGRYSVDVFVLENTRTIGLDGEVESERSYAGNAKKSIYIQVQ